MPEPLVPTAKLMLDRERTLRMDLNVLNDFEQMTGKSILAGDLNNMAQLKIDDARALLWACLVHEDESLTIREVGAMIHIGNLNKVITTLNQLITSAMPESEGESDSPLPEAVSTDSRG